MNYIHASLAKPKEYLVLVFNIGAPYTTIDELHYYIYHHVKNITFTELPPTNFAIKAHILHAFHATYLQLHCLSNPELDPTQVGFEG